MKMVGMLEMDQKEPVTDESIAIEIAVNQDGDY